MPFAMRASTTATRLAESISTGRWRTLAYVDFAYVAFDLGQTFQISDTDLETSQLRGIVLRHTLLSYVFSTVVLATVINLVASLG